VLVVTEAIAVTDTVRAAGPAHLTVTETVAVTDTTRAAGPAHLTVTETVAVTDTTRAAGPAHLTVTETVAVTDTTRAAGPAHLTVTETVAVSDDTGPLATVSCSDLVLGEEVDCTVDGLDAGQQVQVTVEVNPTLHDEVLRADDRGQVAFRFTIPATLVVGDEVRLTVTAEDDTVLFTSVLGRIAEAASPDGPRAPVGEEASQEPTGGGGEVVRGAPDASNDDAGQQPPALQRTGAMSFRILLSPPDVGETEREALLAAFDSGWIAPVGPDLDAFEAEVAARAGRGHAVALASGTAALQLGLLALGSAGRRGAGPDADVRRDRQRGRARRRDPGVRRRRPDSWNLDVDLVADELDAAPERRAPARRDRPGRPLRPLRDYTRLLPVAAAHGIPVLSDAAEALGATHAGRPAGAFGAAAVFSFNGNKIITTSGGGMLVTDDADLPAGSATSPPRLASRPATTSTTTSGSTTACRTCSPRSAGASSRARRQGGAPAGHQRPLPRPPRRPTRPTVRARRSDGEPTHWLTCLTVDPDTVDVDRDEVLDALAAAGIEGRPVWKPMHLQPAYADAAVIGRGRGRRLAVRRPACACRRARR
jgi:hypothetical protein